MLSIQVLTEQQYRNKGFMPAQEKAPDTP